MSSEEEKYLLLHQQTSKVVKCLKKMLLAENVTKEIIQFMQANYLQ